MSKLKLRAQLIQALTMRVSTTSCQAVLQQLDDYVDTQLAGAIYTTRFPDVALHLDACVACAEAYDVLYESAVAEARGLLPKAIAQPDLSFLKVRSATTLLEQLRSAIQRVGERISLQLTPTLIPALRPTLTIATLRSGSSAQRYQEKLIELNPEQSWQGEWPVTIVAYRDNQQPANCLLEVTVKPEGWDWPDLEGIQITLSANRQHRTALTDAWGMTAFEEIPTTWLTDLKLEVAL